MSGISIQRTCNGIFDEYSINGISAPREVAVWMIAHFMEVCKDCDLESYNRAFEKRTTRYLEESEEP